MTNNITCQKIVQLREELDVAKGIMVDNVIERHQLALARYI